MRTSADAIARELTWTLPLAAREIRRWRKLAGRIPDPAIRGDALSSFAHKRVNIDGAALFCILSSSRDHRLLRLLVAYQILWDFLDSVNERGADRGTVNGRHLHLALVDALDPALPDLGLLPISPVARGRWLPRATCFALPSRRCVAAVVRSGASVGAARGKPRASARDQPRPRSSQRDIELSALGDGASSLQNPALAGLS